MSIGAVTKAITLDENALTLILGDNIDEGSEGSRNGVGKSVIVDALSYALYGQPVRKISLPNLVNKINNKAMFVTVNFEKDGIEYRIERGRKPDIFRFFVNGVGQNDDDKSDKAQGVKKDSQADIVKIFGMSHLLFKHILALYSKTVPFIDESAARQRELIEELLGITQLSEKAELLRNNIKDTKTEIDREEYRHKVVQDSNKKTQMTIDTLTIKSNGWDEKHVETLAKLEAKLTEMLDIDIDAEIEKHKEKEKQTTILREAAEVKRDTQLALEERNRAIQETYDEHMRTETQLYDELNRDKVDALRLLADGQNRLSEFDAQENILSDNHSQLVKHKCPECGQDIHDDTHNEMVAKSEAALEALTKKKTECVAEIADNEKLVMEKMEALEKQDDIVKNIADVVLEESENIVKVDILETVIKTQYVSIHEAYEHKTNFDNNVSMYEKEVASDNPFTDQIKTITDSIQEIDYTMINEMVNLLNHQDFLLKLLTRKDSNIRIQIVEQNLAFLNSRLDHYCKEIGLPHKVSFGGDLNVDIVRTGNSYDSGNLSGGEATRLVLAFSFAFRDMHEALNFPINILFVDELIDSGMDSKGAEMALHILKTMSRNNNRNVLLISHRDDFIPRVSNVLMVTFENNFTDYKYEIDIEI